MCLPHLEKNDDQSSQAEACVRCCKHCWSSTCLTTSHCGICISRWVNQPWGDFSTHVHWEFITATNGQMEMIQYTNHPYTNYNIYIYINGCRRLPTGTHFASFPAATHPPPAWLFSPQSVASFRLPLAAQNAHGCPAPARSSNGPLVFLGGGFKKGSIIIGVIYFLYVLYFLC